MVRKSMKQILAAVLTSAMVLGCVPSSVFVADAAAETVSEPVAQAELQVAFDQEYAAAGQALSVTVTGGSDVTYTWYVGGKQIANTTSSYTPTEADVENWIEVVVASGSNTASTKMYFSNLPVVYIDTEGGQAITSKENYIDANLKIQGNEEFNSETTELYDGLTEIRGRGNSTWSQPKKPYRLKLDEKADLFGMGNSKHWVLLANYMDESLMRNTYAYDLSGSMGMEQMATVWVNVVLNGDFVGNYQLCENIRVDGNRVDIFDWEGFAEDSGETIGEAVFGKDDEDSIDDLMTYMCEEDMSWITTGVVNYNGATYNIADYGIEVPDINGGYILELDEYWDEVSRFKTESGQPMMFKNPEFVNTNDDMMEFVQTYVQAFEDAVQEEDYSVVYEGEETHYSELYEFDSLVDYWLICEIFFQEEINKKSTYMYKDIDGLMKMGPIWDMDWSSGGEGDTQHTNKWATLYFNANAQASQWYKYLVKDPYFLVKAQERYWEIRYAQLQDMLDRFDGDYEYLKESAEANGQRWWYGQSYEYYANHFNTWMNNHVTWLDEQMATEASLDSSFYYADSNLQLTLADAEGNELNGDIALKAAADYSVAPDTDVVLTVTGISGTADVYVNSSKYGQVTTGEALTISASALTAAAGEKNVIEVKVANTYGMESSANYVTVREKASGTDTGVDKSALETLIYEAAEKEKSHYSSETWAPFQEAYTNACATALNTAATKEEVDAAKEALETAMAALVEIRDPADASDDYDVTKITYSAGSSQDGEGIELAFDGNEGTIWHSQYDPHPDWYGTEAALEHFWVLFELEEATVLDAVRYLPRNNNGDIKSYRVEGSIDGETWATLTEGNWEYSTATWQSAEFAPTELKYVRLWATNTVSNSNRQNVHVSAAELRLRTSDGEENPLPTPTPTPVGEEIPVSEMTATAGNWETEGTSTEGPAEFAIDEDTSTLWHTDWEDGTTPETHWIQLELKSEYNIDGFRYLPRQSGENGIITKYQILVSLDGENWEEAAEGDWAGDISWKEVTFEAQRAKYVRLVSVEALSDQLATNGNHFAAAAEIRLTGTVYDPTVTPDPTPADKTALNNAITAAEALDSAEYTEKSWAAFAEALQAAKVVAAKEDATQEEISAALAALEVAEENLVEVGTSVPERTEIAVEHYKVSAGDSQSGEGPEMAIDGDTNTMWHTNWDVGDNHDNHWYMIELDGAYMVDGFNYLPRQAQANGIITKYQIEVSLDGEEWTKAAEGDWAADSTQKEAVFEPVKAKYVRLLTIKAESDQSIVFASAAEIRLTGTVVACAEHTVVVDKAVAATCTEKGLTEGSHCSVCKTVLVEQEEIAAFGHTFGEWTTTKDADCTEAGSKEAVCSVCKEKITEEIAAPGHEWSEWTVVKEATYEKDGLEEHVCETCGEKEERKIDKLVFENPFEDVEDGKWYYDAVMWGARNGIVNGLQATVFGPKEVCERGQIVTFLWRAEGEPKAENRTHPFTDAEEGKYYYEAMLWALEEGIIKGYTDDTFAPKEICTRSEMATILWRHAGEVETGAEESPFADVEVGKWYFDAAVWASENGVIEGYDNGLFGTKDTVTRDQTVTMLYRYYSNK